MCGIAGMAGISDEPLLKRMLAVTRHRGPDDTGTWAANSSSSAGRVAIGNNRLSIIDLSPAGHQPMCNEDGTIWVAYNGEMYNFPELRQELVSDGHQFKSHTDTEVLVHLYEKHGVEMVRRLNGIFAFAIWDSSRQELFICRDRMGIKPLYYAQAGERLYFCSEIKALLQSPEVSVDLDYGALYQYLAYLYVPQPATLFKGIAKLPPGHWMRWRKGQVEIKQYWNLSYGDYFKESEAELAGRLRELLVSTTKRQLISDVPVGFFLSGGLDSSTLVACAARAHDADLKCYSIAYKEEHGRMEQCSDDARYARIVASHFGAQFHEIEVDPQVANLLPKVVWHMDEPVADPSAISAFLICQAAAPFEKVLLSGQGADEVFAGYRVHRAHKTNGPLRLVPRKVRQELAPAWLKWLRQHKELAIGISPGLLMAGCRFADKMLRTSAMNPQEQYSALRSYLLDEDLRGFLAPIVNSETAGLDHTTAFIKHFADVAKEDFVNQMLYVDAKTFLPDLNLVVTDKMSMANSVEVRVPFLDNEVVDFLSQVPPSLKIHGLTQKYLLRKSMEGVLPAPILTRRKAAFGLPIRSWFKNELREMLHDLLSEDRVKQRGLLDPAAVSKMLRDHETGEQDSALPIWSLLTLELWHQAFVDQGRTVAPEAVLV